MFVVEENVAVIAFRPAEGDLSSRFADSGDAARVDTNESASFRRCLALSEDSRATTGEGSFRALAAIASAFSDLEALWFREVDLSSCSCCGMASAIADTNNSLSLRGQVKLEPRNDSWKACYVAGAVDGDVGLWNENSKEEGGRRRNGGYGARVRGCLRGGYWREEKRRYKGERPRRWPER